MRTLVHKIGYSSRADTYRFFHITDTHLGARACNETLLRQHIKQIADDPHALWGHGGDALDCIARKGDKRYDEERLAVWLRGKNDAIGTQRDYAVELFRPIMNKCLYWVEGNHERAALQYYDRNIYKELVRATAQIGGHADENALALGVQGFVALRFRRTLADSSGSGWTLMLYTHHGAGGGSMPGGHALALGRVLSAYECDLALLGHRHVEQYLAQVSIQPTTKGYRTRTRAGLFVASYLDSYINDGDEPSDSYPEMKMLPPTVMGTSPILIDPDSRQFHVTFASGGTGAGSRRIGFVDELAATG